MTDGALDRLRKDCPEWSDEYLAEQFSMGQAAFRSSEAWDIEGSPSVGDPGRRRSCVCPCECWNSYINSGYI